MILRRYKNLSWKIIEWTIEQSGLEKTLKILQFPISVIDMDTFYYTRLFKNPSSMALNTSREAPYVTSLGNLSQCLTTLIVKKKLFLRLNLTFLCLKSFPFILSLHSLTKKASVSFRMVSAESSILHGKQSQIAQPVLSGEKLHPSDHLCGPSLDPFESAQICCMLGALECCRWGIIRAEWRERIISLDLLIALTLIQLKTWMVFCATVVHFWLCSVF